MGLDGVGSKYPWQLSGGMQQRVAIARALVSRPEVVFLDEPFASVDALTRAELQDVLLGVHAREENRRVTIVHVTHDVDEAVYLADRVLVLAGSPGTVAASIEVGLARASKADRHPEPAAVPRAPERDPRRDRAGARMTPAHVVGRDAELAHVGRFLDGLAAEPGALLVEGEAGIGKTTIWTAAIGEAESRGMRVLQARAVETEAQLSYAALADLVGADFEATRHALPAIQQRALAAALLRAESDEPAQPRTIATAFVGVLAAFAEAGAVLVAVDDVQWLDPASAGALSFAARRLPVRVGLLLTRRGDSARRCRRSASTERCPRADWSGSCRGRCRSELSTT